MAMGLFGALKISPWGDVVAAAPTVVRGAQQLWNKVRHDAPAPAAPMQQAAAAAGPAAAAGDPVAAFDARLQALESRAAQRAREASAASELIATLAEQNAGLIEAVDRLRRQARLLAVAAGALGIGVVAALALALLSR